MRHQKGPQPANQMHPVVFFQVISPCSGQDQSYLIEFELHLQNISNANVPAFFVTGELIFNTCIFL